jgi:hypothetical protein
MKISRALLALTTILAVPALTHADELFRLTFSGTAHFLNERDNIAGTRLTATHLMARCVGTNNLGTNHPYLLVYNTTSDRIQVVNSTNGAIMCDVLELQTAYANINDHRSERLAFVFVPEQTNSVGNAIVVEKLDHPAGRIAISGRAQFVLASLESESANSRFDDSTTTNGSSTISASPLTAITAAATTATTVTTAADVGSVPLPPGVPTISGSSSSTGSGTAAQTNTVPVGQSPGTLLSLTNNGSLTDTNLPGLPGTSPGTLLDTTNSPSPGATNGVTIPGLPSAPGTLLDTTNNVSTNVVVTIPNTPGVTNGTGSVVGVPSVPGTITSGATTNDLAQASSHVVTNVVICTGNFAAGRRLRVPAATNGN